MEHSLRNLQVQKMMPQTLHSLQLLSLPLLALKTYLSGIVLDNPYLEPRFDTMEMPLSAYAEPGEAEMAYEGEDRAETLRSGAGHLPFLEQIYAPENESLYDHLSFQAGLCAFSEAEATAARYLISHISSAGYLEESLETAASEIGCDYSLVKRVLGVVQGFTPRGVGARCLSECLCLQADPQAADYAMLTLLLREDLAALAGRKFEFLARKYKISRTRLQKMLDYVQTLNPKPGSCFSSSRLTPYIMPDATVSLSGQRLDIRVGGEASALLSFDPDYMKDVADEEASAFLRQKRLEALNLLSSLDMRSRALERLVAYLAVEQRAFFIKGAAALRPLTQRKAASDLRMSPSTICRCVREKYIVTPQGCFKLDYFFPGGLGGGSSSEQARASISALIAGEDRAAPLSDLAISELLAAKGIQISRRTVSKYRAQLGLGCQLERIRYF